MWKSERQSPSGLIQWFNTFLKSQDLLEINMKYDLHS